MGASKQKSVSLMDVVRYLGCTSKEVRSVTDEDRIELKASLQAGVDDGSISPSEFAPKPKAA